MTMKQFELKNEGRNRSRSRRQRAVMLAVHESKAKKDEMDGWRRDSYVFLKRQPKSRWHQMGLCVIWVPIL